MTQIAEEQLVAVRSRESLYAFLKHTLNWPTDPSDTFTYRVDAPGASPVAADVTQIVPFTGEDPYRIYLVETRSPIRRRDLRESLRQVRAHLRSTGRINDTPLDRLLFVCGGPNYDEIRFVKFTQQKGRQPRICSFGWERARAQETRTVREMCLPKLYLARDSGDTIKWDVAQWDQAWDVAAVTEEFYRNYKVIFEELKGFIAQQTRGDDEAHLVTQRLLHRIMFCWFLQRKGWLYRQQDYLRGLFELAESHRRSHGSGPRYPNYYRDYLWPLFFCALNTPSDDRPTDEEWSRLAAVVGQVPFLNGGLFAPEQPYDARDALSLPNEAFAPILELFEGYHFTVTESTPDDVEVALDPELLGQVYERLAIERHDTGSYYTPRAIVAFMCKEALKSYLRDCGSAQAVHAFVENGDASGLSDPEDVLARLQSIRVCDPACGSGAYLVGMMQEILRLCQALFVARTRDHAAVHDRKLEIIQLSLYGADLARTAVETAMLRLWLSLVVDDPRDPVADPDADVSLPNLKFKFACGDSVSAPHRTVPNASLHAEEYARIAAALRSLHDKYFAPASTAASPKDQIAASIGSCEAQVRDLLGGTAPPGSVEWDIACAEVFASDREPFGSSGGGFDVVITNPPYVRQERLARSYRDYVGLPAWPEGSGRDPYGAPYKSYPQQTHPDVACGTADLYVYFYSRAVQLLKPGGVLAFISSNKWFRAKYGEKLRAHMADTCDILSITDFGELPVFDAGTFPMIFIARKRTEAEKQSAKPSQPEFTQVKSLEPPYPDVAALIERDGQTLPPSAINKSVWLLTGASEAARIKQMEQAGVPLGTYVHNRIYYGIKTGFNEAFILDERKRDELIAADPRSAEIIKPLAVGDDIRRWHIRDKKRWLILTQIGVDMARYPAVFAHLKQYQPQLEKRWDKGEQWWELRACAYYDVFEREKIVYPVIGKEPRFTFDTRGHYTNDKTFLLPVDDLYLAAILNSDSAWAFLKSRCSAFGDEDKGGRLELRSIYIAALPIPDASETDRSRLAELARKCLDARAADPNADVTDWEREIDGIVEGLYGL